MDAQGNRQSVVRTDDTPLVAGAQPVDRATRLTRSVSQITAVAGSFPAILAAVTLVVIWVIGGFFVRGGFGNQLYQIVVSTVSSIVTFVMVFVIQSSQNRDSRALQAKMDAQSITLARIAEKLNVADDEYLLTRLAGMEDAPAAAIAAEQAQVRDRASRAAAELGPDPQRAVSRTETRSG